MLKKSDLKEFQNLLLILQARVRGDVAQLTGEALRHGSSSSDSRSPTHNAELGTENYEQDFALRVVENDQEMLGEIRDALNRIEDGTYGICELCHEDGRPRSKSSIPKTRLRAIPFARNCVSCERRREEFSL